MVGINDSRQKIVTNGLSVNYDPAQLRSYPTTGTTVFDLSGNGNNGTLNGGVVFSSGFFRFDGNTGNISTPYNHPTANNLSICLWFRFLGDNAFKILAYIGDNNTSGIGLLQLNNNQIGVFYGGITISAINNGTSVATLTPSVWTQLAITRNGSRTTLYQDGAYLGFTDNTPGQNTISSNLSIGVTSFPTGDLGAFEFYNRQLSDEEILQNFNANKIRYNL